MTPPTSGREIFRRIFLAFLCFLCMDTSFAQNNVVRVHYGYFTEARPIHAACARGWFDYSAGGIDYKVTCYPQTSGGFAVSRLDSGQLDISNLGSTPMAEAAARGIPLSAFYVSHYMGDSQGIYVRATDDTYQGIENPFDLTGRKIGVPFGSTMHYQVLFLLDLFGILGEVEVVNLSPAEIVQAWDQKSVDAVGCWGEARDYVLKLGGSGNSSLLPASTLMSAAVLADWGRPTFVVVAARRQFSTDHPQFMEHMVSVLSQINDSFLDNLGAVNAQNVARWNVQGSPGESMVPSMADSLMKAGEVAGSPSQTFKNSQRSALDQFIQYTADEQLGCDFLGAVGCENATTLEVDLIKTADFLLDQKIVPNLGVLNISKVNNAVTSCTGGELCFQQVFEPNWLNEVQTLGDVLSVLEQIELSPFPENEIGRGTQGQIATGDSTCSGHRLVELTAAQVTIGDGANGITGLSYTDNLSCSWEIRSPDCSGGSRRCSTAVVLDFLNFRVWSGDFVRIYTDENFKFNCNPDSPDQILLGQFTGLLDAETMPRIAAPGCIRLEFTTDSNQERSYGDAENLGDGFRLLATTSENVCSSGVNTLQPEGIAWGADCDFKDYCIGTSIVNLAKGRVSQRITNDATFESELDFANSERLYPNDLDCTFRINLDGGAAGDIIEVNIWYDLEESYDFLTLQTGSQSSPYIVLTGSTSGANETYYLPTDSDGVATLRLTSDSKGRHKGFFAEVRGTSRGIDSSCLPGFSGTSCEIPRCNPSSRVEPGRSFDLGRVVSQPPGRAVPAMPWSEYPDGGCVWQFENPADDIQRSVAVRLKFDSALDLEPYPPSKIGDMLVLRADGDNEDFVLYLEACDTDEVCSLAWQTGECTTTEPRACAVHTTVEFPIEGATSVEALLVTDRNDGGYTYSGFDFLASLVDQCPESGKDCSDIKKAECIDGFCVCKGGRPCDCPCEGSSRKLKIGLTVGIVGVLFVIFMFCFLRYRRKKIIQSRAQKAVIEEKEAQLEAFRNSVVGMRIATVEYIPSAVSMDSQPKEQAKPRRKSKIRKSVTPKKPEVTWCWKETDFMMKNHKDEDIVGDQQNCWIRYTKEIAELMEAAYMEQGHQGTFSPLPGYMVDFASMTQTKLATGFVREVQRLENGEQKIKDEHHAVDISEVLQGAGMPIDIIDEPQMVLVVGDIIQISAQRDDGWAFGTKLSHSDEQRARDLVQAVQAASGKDEDLHNVFTDTGWFQMSATEIPSGEELAQLQERVGDTDLLAAPENWTPVSDPTVVELVRLDVHSDEKKEVVRAFMSTLKNKTVKVAKVERIQNLAMWQSFVVKRETICYRERDRNETDGDHLNKQKVIERFERCWLWHGTNADVMDKIMQQGFNRSFCGKNATMYGKGVYFARDASYSAYPTYAVPDNKGYQYIMACRVVVGEYCRGTKDALTPDVRDTVTHSLYDSTVGLTGGDDMTNPSIYVTYHDAQAYPEYLIKFSQT